MKIKTTNDYKKPIGSEKYQDRTTSLAFIAAVAVVFLLSAVFAGRFFIQCSKDGLAAVDSTINPNTASLASLMRLPGIGPKKAQTIIDYRDSSPAQPAFACPADLQNIKGIGPKTVEKIGQYLYFSRIEDHKGQQLKGINN